METALSIEKPARKPALRWLWGLLVKPAATLKEITSASKAVWLLPLVVLTLAATLNVLSAGRVRQIAAQSGQVELPPEFEYYPPEMQAQFMQAIEATSGPAFLYVLPALGRFVTVWGGWLLVGGLLHLGLTMVGGRNSTESTLNLAAWASLPLALRDVVRAVAIYASGQLIQAPGLSGFASLEASNWGLYQVKLLGLIDLYTLWYIALLAVGAHYSSGVSRRKAWAAVIGFMALILALEALAGFGVAQFSGIKVMRPFIF